MKFAIPIAEGKLSSHFGHCREFAFLDVENGGITNRITLEPPPHEPGVLPKWLIEQGVNVVIAGGMGARAEGLLEAAGIKVRTGAPPLEPESLVQQYLDGSLITVRNPRHH